MKDTLQEKANEWWKSLSIEEKEMIASISGWDLPLSAFEVKAMYNYQRHPACPEHPEQTTQAKPDNHTGEGESEEITLSEFSRRFNRCFVFRPIERKNHNATLEIMFDVYKETFENGEPTLSIEQFAETAMEIEAMEINGMILKSSLKKPDAQSRANDIAGEKEQRFTKEEVILIAYDMWNDHADTMMPYISAKAYVEKWLVNTAKQSLNKNNQ
jgi:hypothetical protein